MQGPFIILQEGVDYFFHCQVRNQLILRQTHSCDRIKMANPLEMLFDILPLVSDSTGRNHWLLQDLEANLAAQVVGYFSFLQKIYVFICINKINRIILLCIDYYILYYCIHINKIKRILEL